MMSYYGRQKTKYYTGIIQKRDNLFQFTLCTFIGGKSTDINESNESKCLCEIDIKGEGDLKCRNVSRIMNDMNQKFFFIFFVKS